MSRPTDAGNFAEATYAHMAPVADQDEKLGWPLLIFLGALGSMFEQVDSLAHSGDGTDPWTKLLDIDRVPDEGLPWLGQFIGVSVDPSDTPNVQRQKIRDHRGWLRGTPQALVRAIQPFLTGSKTVVIIERDTSPYHFELITYMDETPPDSTLQDLYDDYATLDLFNSAWGTLESYWLSLPRNFITDVVVPRRKPASLQYVYTVTPGSPGTFKNLETLYIDYAKLDAVYDALQTLDDVYINP